MSEPSIPIGYVEGMNGHLYRTVPIPGVDCYELVPDTPIQLKDGRTLQSFWATIDEIAPVKDDVHV